MKKPNNSRIQINSIPVKTKNISAKINKINKELLSKIDNLLLDYDKNNTLESFKDNLDKNPSDILKEETQKQNELNSHISSYINSLNMLTGEEGKGRNLLCPIKTGKQEEYNSPEESVEKEEKEEKEEDDEYSDNEHNKSGVMDLKENVDNIVKEVSKGGKKVLPKIGKKKLKNPLKKKGDFLTGVGLTKNKKKNLNKKKANEFIAKTDEEINNMLKNIDSIDDFIKETQEDKSLFKGSKEFMDQMDRNKKDFEELVRELDDYKKEIHEEFDIVQYLVNFTNNTEKLIDRHKNVIGNIFKGAGINPIKLKDFNDEEEGVIKIEGEVVKQGKTSNQKSQKYLEVIKEIEEKERDAMNLREMGYDSNLGDMGNELKEINQVFYKMKKINQIKDNLSNIQDDFLDYHAKLKDGLNKNNIDKI